MKILVSNNRFAIAEFEPCKRTIAMASFPVTSPGVRVSFAHDRKYFVQFPYMVFGLTRKKEFKVFFSCKPITSLTDKLFLPFLGNVDATGECCLGDAAVEELVYRPLPETESDVKDVLVEDLKYAVKLFWQTKFSGDVAWIGNTILSYTEMGNYLEWQNLTKNNSQLINECFQLREVNGMPFDNFWVSQLYPPLKADDLQ